MIRIRGVGTELVPRLESADIHFVEELAELTDLNRISERAELSREQVDQLRHAAQVFLRKEAAGEDMEPSTANAGPEDDYSPSVLLSGEVETAEDSTEAQA